MMLENLINRVLSEEFKNVVSKTVFSSVLYTYVMPYDSLNIANQLN